MKILGKAKTDMVDTNFEHVYLCEFTKEELTQIMLQLLYRADPYDQDPPYKIYQQLKEQLKQYEN